MKNSVSFNVDHSKLPRGIYLSKIDTLGNVKTMTLDIRLRRPYAEDILTNLELHTFEHCFATAIRDESEAYKDMAVSYFGPMGCQTGFYLVLNCLDGDEQSFFKESSSLLKNAITALRQMKEVPAKNELQCGYCYTLGELDTALAVAGDMELLIDEMIEKQAFFKYTYL